MRASAVAAAVLVALVATACTEEPPAVDEPAAVVTPVPSPTTTPAPPAPSPSPSPTVEPEPTPSAAPSPAELDRDAALAAARARWAEREDCDTGVAEDAHAVLAERDGVMLVHVVCFVGAYQPSGELALWDGSVLTPFSVEQWQFGEPLPADEVTGYVEASPDGDVVVNDVKYRGLGDCGMQQRWSFAAGQLTLELVREQECSDDGTFVPPDQWPVVFER